MAGEAFVIQHGAEAQDFPAPVLFCPRGQAGVHGFRQALNRLAMVPGGGKCFNGKMERAVLAYRKLNGMSRNAIASKSVVKRVFNGVGGYRVRKPGLGDHMEAPLSRQVIVFAKGVHSCLPELASSGADVLGVDWTTPLDQAGAMTGDRVVLQGNLDPCVLLSHSKERIEREAQRVLNEARGLKGHIFNLGHGILPETPVENMAMLVEAVKRLGVRRVPRGL